VVDKVLTHHHVAHPYAKGSWGPREADRMIDPYGGWHDPVLKAGS
jgi:glucose-6-phosphate 1-dehydrogenase